ncbi:MAG: tetratricopeptide repeat protein, partial [Gemmatimonadota bacterium]
ASELDPRSTHKALEVAITHAPMRNYAEAERYCDRAISLAPDLPDAYLIKMWLYVVWQGSAENARAVYRDALERVGPGELASGSFPPGMGGVAVRIIGDEYAENFLRLPAGSVGDSAGHFLLRAEVHGRRGERELEYAYYDSARVISEAAVEERRAGYLVHMQLGRAYAGLGRKEEAIRAGQRAVDALPVSRDAFWGPLTIANLAMIYVVVGEHDAALDRLEYLLSIPSDMSIPLLQTDPIWAPLRDHPRFQRLVEGNR